jgi:hypothetical protein
MAANPSTKTPSATATPTYYHPTAEFGYAISDSDFSDTDLDLSESDESAYDLAEGFSGRLLLQAAECEQNATVLLAERLANVQVLTVRGDLQNYLYPSVMHSCTAEQD